MNVILTKENTQEICWFVRLQEMNQSVLFSAWYHAAADWSRKRSSCETEEIQMSEEIIGETKVFLIPIVFKVIFHIKTLTFMWICLLQFFCQFTGLDEASIMMRRFLSDFLKWSEDNHKLQTDLFTMKGGPHSSPLLQHIFIVQMDRRFHHPICDKSYQHFCSRSSVTSSVPRFYHWSKPWHWSVGLHRRLLRYERMLVQSQPISAAVSP